DDSIVEPAVVLKVSTEVGYGIAECPLGDAELSHHPRGRSRHDQVAVQRRRKLNLERAAGCQVRYGGEATKNAERLSRAFHARVVKILGIRSDEWVDRYNAGLQKTRREQNNGKCHRQARIARQPRIVHY